MEAHSCSMSRPDERTDVLESKLPLGPRYVPCSSAFKARRFGTWELEVHRPAGLDVLDAISSFWSNDPMLSC